MKIAAEFLVPVLYFVISLPVFYKVYHTSREIIDEEFHLRQAKWYCQGRFDKWDSKITTLPGLYMISAVLLPQKRCTTFNLRLISLVFSAINLFIILHIKKALNQKASLAALEALSISILPPLYFFAHLYYTDVVSLTTVLALKLFWLRHRHGYAALFGLLSVLMRQTNIVWVGMLFGASVLKIFTSQSKLKYSKRSNDDILSLVRMLMSHLRHPSLLLKCMSTVFRDLWGYIVVILLFLSFVIINGSIVVGDKSAHQATIHIPQIFYFSLFVSIFGISFVLPTLPTTLRSLKLLGILLIPIVVVLLIIVKYNTLVHLYLLADNRHYTFYIWNRFFGRFDYFKYIMVPIYVVGLTCVDNVLRGTAPVEDRVMFYVATSAALCLQNLLEVRYFLIPFILLRINVNVKRKYAILEFLYYILINCLTFHIFFTKKLYWPEFSAPQRIIW